MVIARKIINSRKEFKIHRAAQGSLSTSMKQKGIPHKHRFLFYHLQHGNNSSSHQLYLQEMKRTSMAAVLDIFI